MGMRIAKQGSLSTLESYMQTHLKMIVVSIAAALAGGAVAQTPSIRGAASAAVTPGDQNMGRNPENRSGGLMGAERQGNGSGATGSPRPARADRG